jgi:hypothetical protein
MYDPPRKLYGSCFIDTRLRSNLPKDHAQIHKEATTFPSRAMRHAREIHVGQIQKVSVTQALGNAAESRGKSRDRGVKLGYLCFNRARHRGARYYLRWLA